MKTRYNHANHQKIGCKKERNKRPQIENVSQQRYIKRLKGIRYKDEILERAKCKEIYVLAVRTRNFTSVRKPDTKLNRLREMLEMHQTRDKLDSCRNEHAPRSLRQKFPAK